MDALFNCPYALCLGLVHLLQRNNLATIGDAFPTWCPARSLGKGFFVVQLDLIFHNEFMQIGAIYEC
jgi:hypothetical protein